MLSIRVVPFFLILLFAGWLAGCTTGVYQLTPVSGDVGQLNGRPVTRAEQDSVAVVASYEREDLGYVALDIEVKNLTTHPIEVDPARFYTVPLDKAQGTLPDPLNPARFQQQFAADPVTEARQVAASQAGEEKRLKRAKIFNTVLMVATVASAVAASGKSHSYRESFSRQINVNTAFQAIQTKRIIDYTTFANRMQRYDYEAYRWHDLALKRTTVAPGESVRGFVYLPKAPKAAFLQLVYPASDTTSTDINITFAQQVVKKRS